MSAAEMCRAFCPAAPTQLFSEAAISRTRLRRTGSAIPDLPNAFVYRDKVVAMQLQRHGDCVGLVRFEETEDPTLRTGDIVATQAGFMAIRATAVRQAASSGRR